MIHLRNDSVKLNLSLCTSGGEWVVTALVIFCTLFTLATVDFGASYTSQGSLEWRLGSGPKDRAWKSREQILENVVEVAEIPIADESSGDGGYEEVVERAPTPTGSALDLKPSEEDISDWDETPAPESGDEHDESSTNWDYGVCLLVRMGRQRRARVPYSELYRLFDAAKSLRRRTVFLGTSSENPTIFCNMARDALGSSARCENFNRFGASTTKCEHLVVGATQRYVAQPSPSELQRHGFQWTTLHFVNLDAADPARQPPPLPESQWRPTVVTAFSSNHAEVGLLLLRSLGRVAAQQREFNVSVVVWTMDQFPAVALRALDCVAEELKSVYAVDVEVRAFDFGAWPPWMRINQKKGYNGGRGEYAWKAVMIHTVLVERGFVYWADAGDRFKTVEGLTQTLRHVKRHGFASRHSSGQVRQWTHPMQLRYFDADDESVKRRPNCDASGIGFTLQSYSKLARPWYECSVTRQCIAPAGSSRKNHRQDQSALTLLVILTGGQCEGVDSGVMKNMDSHPDSYHVGVDATRCYRDPLNIKWHRRLFM